MNYLVKDRHDTEVAAFGDISAALHAAPSHGAGAYVERADDGKPLAVVPVAYRGVGTSNESEFS